MAEINTEEQQILNVITMLTTATSDEEARQRMRSLLLNIDLPANASNDIISQMSGALHSFGSLEECAAYSEEERLSFFCDYGATWTNDQLAQMRTAWAKYGLGDSIAMDARDWWSTLPFFPLSFMWQIGVRLSYRNNGHGEQPEPQCFLTDEKGYELTADDLPTLTDADPNVIFQGWTDAAGTGFYGAGSVVTSNTTLYAKWQVPSTAPKITYNGAALQAVLFNGSNVNSANYNGNQL